MLALDAERRAAAEAEEAACGGEREKIATLGRAAFDADVAEAFDAWEAVIDAMSETPADGLGGIAVKAAQFCRALDVGATKADRALADSLEADLVRLVPGFTT